MVENKMKQVLYWIGFRVASSQQALVEGAFGSFKDVRMLMEKEIIKLIQTSVAALRTMKE